MKKLLFFPLFFVVYIFTAHPSQLVWQTQSDVILRFDVDGIDLVFQVVGDKNSDKQLYHLNTSSRKLTPIKASNGLRPFGPSVKKSKLVYGAGNFFKNVKLELVDLKTFKRQTYAKDIPWIIEPVLTAQGTILTELAQNFDGKDVKIVQWNALGDTRQSTTIVQGPLMRGQDIPPDMHDSIKNEYPEFANNLLTFQNDEYGTPNIYVKNLATSEIKRLSPSHFYQERPDISDRFAAWEESERGFGVSNESFIGVYDLKSGEKIKLGAGLGFHYQVRVFEGMIIYGAKRQEAPNTPSIRIYDMDAKIEYKAHYCFPGPIYDWRATPQGVYVAQRNGNNSRILLASWSEIKSGCSQ